LSEASKPAEVKELEEKKADEEALAKALKTADKPTKKKKLPENTLAQFYNKEAGLWMYDTTLVSGDDEFDTEKVHTLEPLAYKHRADSNTIDGKHIQRTTFYLNQK